MLQKVACIDVIPAPRLAIAQVGQCVGHDLGIVRVAHVQISPAGQRVLACSHIEPSVAGRVRAMLDGENVDQLFYRVGADLGKHAHVVAHLLLGHGRVELAFAQLSAVGSMWPPVGRGRVGDQRSAQGQDAPCVRQDALLMRRVLQHVQAQHQVGMPRRGVASRVADHIHVRPRLQVHADILGLLWQQIAHRAVHVTAAELDHALRPW